MLDSVPHTEWLLFYVLATMQLSNHSYLFLIHVSMWYMFSIVFSNKNNFCILGNLKVEALGEIEVATKLLEDDTAMQVLVSVTVYSSYKWFYVIFYVVPSTWTMSNSNLDLVAVINSLNWMDFLSSLLTKLKWARFAWFYICWIWEIQLLALVKNWGSI